MKKRIIYVDATIKDEKSKISLYDTENNLTNILELKNITDINQAELYGVLYAILYVVKNNYSSCHILGDNKGSVENKIIQKLAKENKLSISWIPREINVIADKILKLEPTVKVKEWYILNMFYKLIINSNNNKI